MTGAWADDGTDGLDRIELWSPAAHRLRRAIAAQLAADHHPNPEMAATSIAVRGALGLSRDEFARHTRTSRARLAEVEDGFLVTRAAAMMPMAADVAAPPDKPEPCPLHGTTPKAGCRRCRPR